MHLLKFKAGDHRPNLSSSAVGSPEDALEAPPQAHPQTMTILRRHLLAAIQARNELGSIPKATVISASIDNYSLGR